VSWCELENGAVAPSTLTLGPNALSPIEAQMNTNWVHGTSSSCRWLKPNTRSLGVTPTREHHVAGALATLCQSAGLEKQTTRATERILPITAAWPPPWLWPPTVTLDQSGCPPTRNSDQPSVG